MHNDGDYDENLVNNNSPSQGAVTDKYFRIIFHVVRNSMGQGGYSVDELNEIYSHIQTKFSSNNIFFVWTGCDVKYIDSDFYYTGQGHQSGDPMSIFKVNSIKDRLNIYLYPKSTCIIGGALGSADDGGDNIGIGKRPNIWLSGCGLNNIIYHELGHMLGLYHTSYNWCLGSSREGPGVNSSGCDVRGDRVCDTPGDPVQFSSQVNNCTWNGIFNSNCFMPPNAINYAPANDNIMSNFDEECLLNFTAGQVENMHNRIESQQWLKNCLTDAYPENNCVCSLDKVYNASATISSPMYINSAIIVKSGATLTISSTINFGKIGSIKVETGGKLILDGATLTKCTNATSWKGIEVYGKQFLLQLGTLGEIEMKNNAIIEHAEIAINATPSANQSSPQYKGGIVTITSGTIRECSIGIKFGQFGNIFNIQDPSSIFGCTFTNCSEGITLFRNKGVTIENCIFQALPLFGAHAGIKSVNSTFKCNQSQFYNLEYGILFENLYPNVTAFDAAGCTLVECQIGIYNGSVDNLVKGTINTCNFIGNNGAGVSSQGICEIDISSNTFVGNGSENVGGGLSSWFTNDASLVSDNQFSNNLYGHIADGNNKLMYLTNCHDNNAESDMDVAGTVFPEQGISLQNIAASNSFSKFGLPSITTNQNFLYYIENGTHYTSERYPDGTGFTRDFQGAFQTLDCGTGFTLPTIPSRFNWWLCPPVGTFLVFQTIQDLKAQKQAIINNTGLSPIIKAIALARLDMCIKKLKAQYVNDTKDEIDGKTTVINFLKNDENFTQRATAYGLMVDEGHYSAARSFLTIIAPENQGEIDFVNSQYMVLDILEGIRTQHSFTPTELINLENIGMARNAYSGFARASYSYVTGNQLRPPFQFAAQPSPRSKEITKNEVSEIKCYPNPVLENSLRIDLPLSYDHTQYDVKLLNMNGNIEKQTWIRNGRNELDISEINSGVLILLISDIDQNVIFTKKIIKI